jgi:CheY-like chemotaxis protein
MGTDEQPKLREPRVLVVDNCVDSADSLCMVLRLWGFDCEASYTADQAIAAGSAYQPNVILMDIGLPGKDGYELARHFRTQSDLPRPALIALTGYGDAGHRNRGEGLFDHYLLKPPELLPLRDLLSECALQSRPVPH